MTVSCSTHQIQYICFLFKLSMCKLYSQKPGMLKGGVLSLGQSQFAQAKKNSKRKTQKKGALACNHAASPTSNQDLYN